MVPLVDLVEVQEACYVLRAKNCHLSSNFLSISKLSVGCSEVSARVVRGASDQLDLVGDPIELGLVIFGIFDHNNPCRAMPTDLDQLVLALVSPEETLLANLQGQVGSLILAQQGPSELGVKISRDQCFLCCSSLP